MTPAPEPASVLLVRQWCGGDEDAARRLHDRYADRLIRLVSARLGGRFGGRFDAEDVVQSALLSVFIGARAGDHHLGDGEPLWPFLVTFTLHKLSNRVRAHLRQGRSVAREAGGDELLTALAEAAEAPDARLEEAEELARLLADARDALAVEKHREIFDLLVAGLDAKAVAARTGRSEKTVRRVISALRQRLATAAS